eukprot:scaffold184610_cov20-Tisochrysis_lutea.AAC.1
MFFQLAPNDQRSWTSAALRPANYAAMSGFAVGHPLGEHSSGGHPLEGCGHRRKNLRQLAHAARSSGLGLKSGPDLQQSCGRHKSD